MGVGATSPRGKRAAIRLASSPISRTFRRARRRGCSRKCSAWKLGGDVMDDASNPFAPLTPAELAEAARQIDPSKAERTAPPSCPPVDAEPGAMAAARLYGRKPDGVWRYATAQDETAFYAVRWN